MFDYSFFKACPRAVALTAPQTVGVFLSVPATTVRFVRCRQHSRQQPLYVVSSHELVSCGNGGNLCWS